MKRLLIALVLCLVPSLAMAQLQEVKYNLGKEVAFSLSAAADASPLTGVTITGISVQRTKDGTHTPTTLTCVASAPTGGQRICSEVGNGQYTIALQNADFDTVGNLSLIPIYTGALRVPVPVRVLSAPFYDIAYGGNVGDAVSFASAAWDLMVTGHSAGGSFGERVTRLPNAPAGASGGLPTVDGSNRVIGMASWELRRGTAQGGTTTTIILDTGASAVNDFYPPGSKIRIVSGTGVDQWTTIRGYAGSTKTVTVNFPFKVTPDSTSGFVISPD